MTYGMLDLAKTDIIRIDDTLQNIYIFGTLIRFLREALPLYVAKSLIINQLQRRNEWQILTEASLM
jgi:hypothetical protein